MGGDIYSIIALSSNGSQEEFKFESAEEALRGYLAVKGGAWREVRMSPATEAAIKRLHPSRFGRPSTLERAFELARAGAVTSVSELRRVLSREGYGDARAQTDGPRIVAQLAELIAEARRAQTSN